jgi:glycosyltransferase involved in cell wall biosynthesis
MKLLVLAERADAEGGTETYLRTLLPALAARGDDVRVIARDVGDARAYGVPCERVAWSDEHDAPDRAAASRVAEIAREFRPDASVAHNVLDSCVLRAAREGAPRFVYHLHDHRPFCPNGDRLYPQGGGICTLAMGPLTCGTHALIHGCAYGPRPRTLSLVAIRAGVAAEVARADATIALSAYVARLAARNGVDAGRTFVVPPPLEDAAFAPSPVPRPQRDAVLFAGRVMPSKGARSLVRAIAKLPVRPLLRIAGEGPDLDATVADARAAGVDVTALCRLDAAALRAAYDGATLIAIPSLWAEPYGLVGIEGFARGRPAVGYAAGGIPEWIGGGGVAVARGDEAALAVAIASLLSPDTWAGASASAFGSAQSYRVDARVEELRTIYGNPAR